MVTTVGGPTECPAVRPTFRQFWRWRYWWQNPGWAEAADVGFDHLWRIVKPRFEQETAPASSNARAAGA